MESERITGLLKIIPGVAFNKEIIDKASEGEILSGLLSYTEKLYAISKSYLRRADTVCSPVQIEGGNPYAA